MTDFNGVQFDEQQGGTRGSSRYMYAKVVASSEPPRIITWLLEHGWAKSEQQAINMMIGLAVLIFAGSLYFFIHEPKTQMEYAREEGSVSAYEGTAP